MPKPRHPLDMAKVMKMRDNGKTFAEIAYHFSLSTDTIRRRFYEVAKVKPKKRAKGKKKGPNRAERTATLKRANAALRAAAPAAHEKIIIDALNLLKTQGINVERIEVREDGVAVTFQQIIPN